MTLLQTDRNSIDKAQIREILELYFSGIDEKDRDSIARCFVDDVNLRMYRDTPSERTHTNGPAFADHLFGTVSKLDLATHALSNTKIDVAGDTASAITHATTTHIRGETASSRGIRYVDEFVRGDDGWRIRRRQHWVLWQFDTPLTNIARPTPSAAASNG